MELWHDFHGPNAGYVLELYERYRHDPQAVDAATRALFERWTPAAPQANGYAAPAAAPPLAYEKIHAAVDLLHALREDGHLAAHIDPLGSEPPGDPGLELATYDLTEDDLRQIPADLVGWPVAAGAANAWEVVAMLRDIYTSSMGYDYDHLHEHEERVWLRNAAETRRFRPEETPASARALLARLIEVETFERFLHRIFPGKTRFSIEGLDMMVPMLDEILRAAAAADIGAVLIGMAHRGRLNVLAHVLEKPYEQILAEFKDPMRTRAPQTRDDLGWTGDVKYHEGAEREMTADDADALMVRLAPNPSHLEHVNPVVAGMARAAGTFVDEPGAPVFDPSVSLPIVIHGDAAFPGQGVVAETFNFSRLPGYDNGGTIHIIANNQIGFTTVPGAGRSTLYASDLAKGFKVPIVHVNADDPVACLEAARLAIAYQRQFQKDFLIDLVGYRRYGHNEGDEPRFTQPAMYAVIDAHPTVRERYGRALAERGVVDPDWVEARINQQMAALQASWEQLAQNPEESLPEPFLNVPPPGAARRVATAVPLDRLRELNAALMSVPDDFTPHPKLGRSMERRRHVLDEPEATAVEWSTAEDLALGSILAEGIAIRLTGEDVMRGTFSHRHAVFFDADDGSTYVPLQSIPQARAAFEIYNSPLTENAVVGFEYGYNIQAPDRLVIWEAQYGDFINGAQTMIDEFLVSGRAKWEQTPSLVMLLPHGYEGAGPDHSTARLERFLQLAARTNMRVANPTTAAQYFHLLRRQAMLLKEDPLPLIVMSPKSLLRHPFALSTAHALAEGRWQPVIADAGVDAAEVRRVVLCSGKVAMDLMTSDHRDGNKHVAVVRVEQLYPPPVNALGDVLAGYPALEQIVWVQEEPRNMGAWDFIRYHITQVIDGRWPLNYIGRPRRASPAEGSAAWHKVNQERIVAVAFSDGHDD